MSYSLKILSGVLIIFTMTEACQEKKAQFRGASAVKCQPDELIKFTDLPDNINACVSTGRLWNFRSEGNTGLDNCSALSIQPFQPCTFDSVLSWMRTKGIGTTKLEEARADNARMFACGISPDGNTLVTQIYFFPKGEVQGCEVEYSATSLTSGCFKYFTPGTDALKAEFDRMSDDEKVGKCFAGEF